MARSAWKIRFRVAIATPNRRTRAKAKLPPPPEHRLVEHVQDLREMNPVGPSFFGMLNEACDALEKVAMPQPDDDRSQDGNVLEHPHQSAATAMLSTNCWKSGLKRNRSLDHAH